MCAFAARRPSEGGVRRAGVIPRRAATGTIRRLSALSDAENARMRPLAHARPPLGPSPSSAFEEVRRTWRWKIPYHGARPLRASPPRETPQRRQDPPLRNGQLPHNDPLRRKGRQRPGSREPRASLPASGSHPLRCERPPHEGPPSQAGNLPHGKVDSVDLPPVFPTISERVAT